MKALYRECMGLATARGTFGSFTGRTPISLRFRIYFQDDAGLLAASAGDEPPMDVDVAILTMPGHWLMEAYPESVLRRTRPRHVVVVHYEDFLRAPDRPLRFVPTLTDRRADEFLETIRGALPDDPLARPRPPVCGPRGATWTMPLPGEWLRFSTAGSAAGPGSPRVSLTGLHAGRISFWSLGNSSAVFHENAISVSNHPAAGSSVVAWTCDGRRRMRDVRWLILTMITALVPVAAEAAYTNFEVSHVHPIALTPSGSRLLVVNTPDARLEVFSVGTTGDLTPESSIPVGLEPVSVVARSDSEAWVANHLSDTVTVVDLAAGTAVRTLEVGDEPTDVAFAGSRAFVAVSQEDAVKVFDLSNLDLAPTVVSLFSRDVRALAVSTDGSKVYAVTLRSGNQTTVVDANIIFTTGFGQSASRLAGLGLNPMTCASPPPPYPPLPPGIVRNPALIDPPNGIPQVGLIVKWNSGTGRWEDEIGADWNDCLPFRLPDHDLFIVDASTLAVTEVNHLGTTLFDVSVHPTNGRIYVPNTDARNFVRFEHPLGVEGHMVDNQLSIVDPASGNAVTRVDLNAHINRASDPSANLAERLASISQPGMMAWASDGSVAYLTAIGSRKLFRVDGSCLSEVCIFGSSRAAPDAVEVGEGPTGVALHEGAGRAYVVNRFTNSVALVDISTLTQVGEVPLHDPSSATILEGRRFLYDGIDSSGHGDAACSSCHISGDMDGLAWDLGNPTGDLVPYSTPLDNVRFIVPLGNQPTECDPAICAAHAGFDPQKGPMTTQTLRAMLEPLHWRGDRPTMNDFNGAFVGLMGKENINTPGDPKGQTDADMEKFRQFALGIRNPPNPNRTVDDQVPSISFQHPEAPFSGNPATGELLFDNHESDANQTCAACHAHPFGAAGGQLGGVTPAEPTTPAATALFFGTADGVPHSDLEVPHLRNMYEKFGPTFGTQASPPDRKTGFGFIHDGSIPDMGTFLSASVFNLTAGQAADIAAFMFFFPTETKPAVGRQATVPAGTPPTGSPADESLVATLETLGDLADPNRHCELTATALSAGRMRAYHFSGGVWIPDVAAEGTVTTAQLREAAAGPVSFLCAPPGSGVRLGGDLDEDAFLDGDDCAPADPETWAPAGEVAQLDVASGSPTSLDWDDPPSGTGAVTYDVVGGSVSELTALGLEAATGCLAGGLTTSAHDDLQPEPASGDAHFYLVRARNACGAGGFGPGREGLDALACP